MRELALEHVLVNPGMAAAGAVIGRIVSVNCDGKAVVEFPGSVGPVTARCAVTERALPPRDELSGARVLLVFEEGDITQPIIVGFVRERLWTEGESKTAQVSESGRDCVHASTIVLEGEKEVVLRCGAGSITMTADGRVVIRGTRLTSRASETNKVRGAVVLIN